MRRFAQTSLPRAALVGIALALGLLSVPAGASAQPVSSVSSEMTTSLARAAESGPQALLARLDEILKANPALAADPQTAADLGRAAALPVGTFKGANLPVYRDILSHIVAAAPTAARPDVTRAAAEAIRKVAATDAMVRTPLAGDIESLVAEARRQAQMPEATRGVRLGDFIVYPEAQLSEFYDNNIFATKTGEVNDYVTVLSPQIYVASDWSKHMLNFQAHTDVTRYKTHHTEDSTDYWFSTEGRYDFTNLTNAFGGLLYGNFHEDRDSPDDVNGIEPTIYTDKRAYAGVSHTIGKVTVRVGGTADRLQFQDTLTSTGPITNGDRDRDHLTSGVRTSYKLNDVFTPFVDGSFDGRNYRLSRDDNGFDRDSTGYKLTAGTQFRVAGVIDGEVYGGYLRQNYDDPVLPNVSTPAFGGNVRWRFIPSTLFIGWFDRSVEETTLIDASSYVFSGGGASIEHDITSALLLTVRGGISKSDFQGIDRIDDEYDSSIGLRYKFADHFYVAGDYRFTRRISNVSTADYARHQVFVRAGVQY